MLPRERVIQVIQHEKPDRIPVYGWVRANLEEMITEEFGSVVAFEDHYEFDFVHLFDGPGPYSKEAIDDIRERKGAVEPADLLEIELTDVNREGAYDKLRKAVRHHKQDRGRFVYVQTPGIFECLNGPFGIENHLAYLLMFPEDLKKVYQRQAEWNRAYAMNCLDLDIDMIHISDDWGSQNNLMFSPETWKEMIFPYHRVFCSAVKDRGAYLSLHTDGNNNSVVDGIIELGYDVVHPWQESAGMSLAVFKQKYRDRLTVMGGLDVQSTIGFGKLDFLEAEIRRVMDMFRDGGLLFCTTHFIQDHCTLEELKFAFDIAKEYA